MSLKVLRGVTSVLFKCFVLFRIWHKSQVQVPLVLSHTAVVCLSPSILCGDNFCIFHSRGSSPFPRWYFFFISILLKSLRGFLHSAKQNHSLLCFLKPIIEATGQKAQFHVNRVTWNSLIKPRGLYDQSRNTITKDVISYFVQGVQTVSGFSLPTKFYLKRSHKIFSLSI